MEKWTLKKVWRLKMPITASLTFIVSTTLLFNDRFLTRFVLTVPSDVRVAGKEVSAQGEILRQSTFALIWQSLSAGDPIYDGDRVFSGARSVAELSLRDISVSLPELSLLEITLEGEMVKIKVEKGKAQLTFEREGQVLIEIDGQEKLVHGQANTKILMQYNETTEAVALSILSGSAKIDNQNEMAAGDSATMDKGHIQVTSGKIVALSPERVITIAPGTPVEFRWTQPILTREFEFDLSQGAKERKSILNRKLTATMLIAPIQNPGDYFWNVRDAQEAAAKAPVPRPLRVIFDDRPFVTKPAEEEIFDLSLIEIKRALLEASRSPRPKGAEKAPLGVSVAWIDEGYAGDYRVQTASDANFSGRVEEQTVKAAKECSVDGHVGRNFVRVARADGKPTPVWGAPVTFEISGTGTQKSADAHTPPQRYFPYPADGALLLVLEHGSLLATFKDVCAASCELEVRGAGPPKVVRFAAGKSPELRFDLPKNTAQEITWKLTEAGEASNGRFHVQPYSATTLKDAMNARRNFEVVK